jgi:Mitochondrial carrier protein
MDSQYKKIESKVKKARVSNFCLSQVIGYGVLSTLTAPLSVLGTTLQLSSKPLEKFYETTTTEVSKLELAKSYDMAVKERKFNELQLSSGMVNANKPFRPPYYANYRQAALALVAQGYQGFFKGNVVEIIRFAIGVYPKYYFLMSAQISEYPLIYKVFIALGSELLTEHLAQPFRTAQTRFVLQNRIPEFVLYRSLYKYFQNVPLNETFQGYNVILPKRLIYFFSLTSSYDSIWKNIGWCLGVLTLVYPLETVQRRLEAQSTEHSMLPRRYIDEIRWTLSRIYHEEGIRGIYRGYICNILANSTKLTLYPILSYILWQRVQEEEYKKEGWSLIN